MIPLLLQGIIILLLWVGAWGILEIAIESMTGDDRVLRVAYYSTMILLALLLVWILSVIA